MAAEPGKIEGKYRERASQMAEQNIDRYIYVVWNGIYVRKFFCLFIITKFGFILHLVHRSIDNPKVVEAVFNDDKDTKETMSDTITGAEETKPRVG